MLMLGTVVTIGMMNFCIFGNKSLSIHTEGG